MRGQIWRLNPLNCTPFRPTHFMSRPFPQSRPPWISPTLSCATGQPSLTSDPALALAVTVAVKAKP